MSGSQIPVVDLAPAEVGELDLYQKRERIYTRRIEGFFQRIRLYTGWPLLILYFAVPWIPWGDRPAVLFDLPARQFHIFFITFWPQDFPMLGWFLAIAAFSLFTVTVYAGRVWCGYTCPQTVWTSIFMWAEQVSEGTRNQRIKLDQGPWNFNKLWRKALKHGMWLGVASLTGITFVGYFVPIREFLWELARFDADFWPIAWSLFFTLATYINAGWLREQVCMFMCPYARFQSVMFDHDTLIVSYDTRRGEPRGSRKKGVEPKAVGLGDCIDCELCVQVCPTGIDIREGLQYQCITCALCIDACDSVMDKMEYPRGLIRYSNENSLEGKPSRILRPRLLGYLGATTLLTVLFWVVLLTRSTVGLDAIRERGSLYRDLGNGRIDNVYTLKIRNMSEQPRVFRLSLAGVTAEIIGNQELRLQGGEIMTLPITVEARQSDLPGSLVKIRFSIAASDDTKLSDTADSNFFSPARTP